MTSSRDSLEESDWNHHFEKDAARVVGASVSWIETAVAAAAEWVCTRRRVSMEE